MARTSTREVCEGMNMLTSEIYFEQGRTVVYMRKKHHAGPRDKKEIRIKYKLAGAAIAKGYLQLVSLIKAVCKLNIGPG